LHQVSTNERDVATEIYNFRYKHIFSRYFAGELLIGFSSFHQIYTGALSSANNNQNETYLLRSGFDWALTDMISLNQGFEIRANYIIYDFVPNPLETPSRIFRRASSETGFSIKVTDRLALMPAYIYRYEDYGKLIWGDNVWQEATGWDRRYHNLDLRLSYQPFAKIRIEPEYSWESKKEYNHVLGKMNDVFEEQIIREQRLEDLKQIAAVSLIWDFSPNEYLTAAYSRRKWEIAGQPDDITEFVNVSVRYQF
jgi:hypothetical protein